jgi:hypothetical protein
MEKRAKENGGNREKGGGERKKESYFPSIVHTSNVFGPTQPNREARTRFMLDYSFFLFLLDIF